MQSQSGNISEIVALILEVRNTERRLEALEERLEKIKNIPAPEGSAASQSYVLAHVFLTDVLPHLPSDFLRNDFALGELIRKFGLTEDMAIQWSSDADNIMEV